MMFNTLRYAKIVEIMEDKLATKQDIRELESRLTLRMGTMLAASITILTAVMTAIHKLV